MYYTGKRISDKLLIVYIRRVPDHPFKIRIINWINDYLLRGVNVISAFGAHIKLSTREYIGHEILYSGSYEPLTINKCREILENGGTFFDIGANIGLFTTQIALNKNVDVYSIEPSESNFIKLSENITSNNSNNIIAINAGLSDHESFGYLINDYPANSGTFQVIEADKEGATLIKLITLGKIIKDHKISEIRLMKIDVEGYEMNVFKGLFELCDVRPHNIIVENSGLIERTGYNMKDCFEYLGSFGYLPYNIYGEAYDINIDLPEANIWFKKN